MGALDEGNFAGELENGVKLESLELNLKDETETTFEIVDAVKVLLQGLGEDCNREGLKKTPLRVAKALREGTKGYRQIVKDIVQGALFPEAGLDSGVGQAGGAGGLAVALRDLNLFSYCESCLLPFQVQCHIGYVPSGQRVLGLSKFSRVADVFAKRLQDPQRLSDEVCSALQNGINPAGVAVVLQCWHIQFPEVGGSYHDQSHQTTKRSMHGWVRALVYSGSGVFENENADVWGDLWTLLKSSGINVEKAQNQSSASLCWCPSRSLDVPIFRHSSSRNCCKVSSKVGPSQSSMISSVVTILHSLGEDPSRNELVGTPHRFVQWLLKFKKSNLEIDLNGFNSAKPAIHQENGNASCSQDEMKSELNIPFWSQCEHHLLPFHGVVHIGYFHASWKKQIERSILESIVHFYGCKLQVQERLTRQIAETISSSFGAEVMVVVEANHICMVSRGIEKVGSSTATIAVLGRFSTDRTAKAMFLHSVAESTAAAER